MATNNHEMCTSVNGDPPVISFFNIDYIVNGKNRLIDCCSKFPVVPFCKSQERQILFNVSGSFSHGMNAILGPSGCGKTSLLDILANRKDQHGLSGTVLVHGIPRDSSYKYTVGYVVQDDICSGMLTVRENLHFSISLRHPEKLAATQKDERVKAVIEEVGLRACADTRVGTEFIRGISGGEKKRTCIGMELVLSPEILFLDEPTTGLDASTANSVMNCLKDLSQRQRTIIFSIHQPRYSIFKIFDTVTLMCQGRSVYHGSATGIVPYFSSHDYQCEPYDNPADFALDVLIDVSHKPDMLKKLNDIYITSWEQTSVQIPQRSDSTNVESVGWKRRLFRSREARSVGVEIFYLAQRTLRNTVRNPSLILSQIGVSIILGIMVGLLFFDLQRTIGSGVQNRRGAIFFIILSQIFINVTALDALIRQRVLFMHEFASGYYRIITYFVAKFLCDLLPLRVIPAILFSGISYFMMGFSRTPSQFFIFLVTVFMVSVLGSSLCFLIAAFTSVFPVALVFAILNAIVMMLFSGFIVDLSTVFSWLSWIKWISACRYGSNILIINEFRGVAFCLSNNTSVCPLRGEQVMNDLDIPYGTTWDLWKNFLALVIMTLLFLILTYIRLVRIKKTK